MEKALIAGIPKELEYGRYRFDSVLGQGGQGVACKYITVSDGTPVAIKIDPEDQRNILAECTFLKSVGPNLSCAPKYILHNTFGGGRRYLVMQYLELSVEEYLSQQKDRDPAIKRLAIDMLNTIKELHEMDYIHRDIKTANFRVHKGKLYLIDFGIK